MDVPRRSHDARQRTMTVEKECMKYRKYDLKEHFENRCEELMVEENL